MQGQRRSVRHHGATLVALWTAILLMLLGATPALADTALASTARDRPSVSVSVSEPAATQPPGDSQPGAPVATDDVAATEPLIITSPTSDALVKTSSVTVSGTKDPAGRVEIQSLTGGAPYCTVPDGTNWSCTFMAPSGRSTVTVFQYFVTNPTPEQALITVRVLPPPTITGGSPLLTTGLITGTGLPGAGIVLSGSSVGACPGIVQPSGFWSCPLDVASSGDYLLSATQTWGDDDSQPGGTSAPVIVRVDRDPPAYPVFTQPVPGSQPNGLPTLFAGTGESGARVEVFVDGTLVCSSSVSAGRWSCAVALSAGPHRVQGIQWDLAGNPSGASLPIAISITPAVAPTQPTQPTPRSGRDTTTPTKPAPITIPSPSPSQNAAQAPVAVPAFPFFPPPIGGISGLPPLDTWGTPTDYGAALPIAPLDGLAWLWGLGFGLGFVALVAVPLRLALGALRARYPRHYFARDHSRLTASQIPQLHPRLTALGAVGAAAALAALAGGIQGEVRFFRLAVAIGIALLALNIVTVALTTRLVTRALGGQSRLRLVPGFLAIAAMTALISRGGGIQPPVIVGVVIAASFVAGVGRRSRGLVALVQLIATMVLGLAAWVAHSALGAVSGFAPLLLSETLSSLCIAAVGSAVLLSLPVSRMPGRLIFEWSPAAWVAVALPAGTLAGVVLAGADTFPVPWFVGVSLTFAAVCLAVWAWIRLIEPTFARTPHGAPSPARTRT